MTLKKVIIIFEKVILILKSNYIRDKVIILEKSSYIREK